ncbi:MAG TPA: YisL family protein [Ureibacillus sp.]|nr:YisL family protein [Ureibacillus sp.]
MDFLTGSTHLHVTTWVVALILFFVAAFASKSKGIHMALRLFYILVIITGGALFIEAMDYGMGMQYGIKFLLGILVISMMEMILVRKSKNKPTTTFWVLFVIFLLAVLFMGFRLPMGQNFLA